MFGHKSTLCAKLQETMRLIEGLEIQMDGREQDDIEQFAQRRIAKARPADIPLQEPASTTSNANMVRPDGFEVPPVPSGARNEAPVPERADHMDQSEVPPVPLAEIPVPEGDENADWEDEADELGDSLADGVPREDVHGNSFVTIVATTGIHHLPLVICISDDGADPVMDAFSAGYFAASFKNPKTFFTFDVLDDFRMANLESKTTPYSYFQGLRRKTNPLFPRQVPNRYAELRRLSRQWRKLKKLKWHGFGHETRPSGAGDLALFCPSCPQPGVNLPDDWEADPNRRAFI